MYMAQMKEVKIRDEYITLGQLLKFEDLVSSGGEIKSFLSSAMISVNGEKEDRRGRKLYEGDRIVIDGGEYVICR